MNSLNKVPRPLITVVFSFTAIGIVMAIRRLLLLSGLIPVLHSPAATSVDADFMRHAVITLMHIIPGALFMMLGPLQFMPQVRAKHIKLHHWSGGIFIINAYIIGITALLFPFVKHTIGGITEAVASVFFALFFIVSISLAWHSVLKKDITHHREWMIRAYGIGLAVVTIRLITAITFAFFKITPQSFIGTAFWLCFTMHLITAEIWINVTRKKTVKHTNKMPVY